MSADGGAQLQSAVEGAGTGLVTQAGTEGAGILHTLSDTFQKLVGKIPSASGYGQVIMAVGGIMLFLGLFFKRRFGGLSKEIMVLGGIAGLIYGAKLGAGK